MRIFVKKEKQIAYSLLYLGSILFANYSIATTNNGVGKNFFYSIQQSTAPLDKTKLISLPIPKMDGISDYVKNHNNTLPDMWGFDQTSIAQTYSEINFPALGTQMTCMSKNGCSGELKIARYNKDIQGLPALIAFQIRNYQASNAENYFVIQDIDNSFNEFYFLDSTNKYSSFNIDQDMQEEQPILFNVKYGEVIGYISFKSSPNERVCLEQPTPPVGTLACTTYPWPVITSEDGSQEKMLNGTFWNLKWYDYLTQGTSFEKDIAVTHGLTKTDTTSTAVQIGAESSIGESGIAQEKITFSYSQTWGTSVSITDSTTTTDHISFPAQNYNQIVGAYSLSLGMKTFAPSLENFLNKINTEKMNNGNFLNWELVKSVPFRGTPIDNSTDALLSSNPNYIYGLLSVKD